MKSILILFVIVFISCSSNNENDIILKNANQKWKLVQMSGSTPNSETTGENMHWQEQIELKEDGTFIKTRTTEGKTITDSGNYAFSEAEDGSYLILEYAKESEIIGNCTSSLFETYLYISAKQLRGSWFACDGPGLEYELVN